MHFVIILNISEMNFLVFRRIFKTSSYVIVRIPKPWKTPEENYLEPRVWHLPFPPPSQVRPRAFLDLKNETKLGPSDKIAKDDVYKKPEYYSYHSLSYYNMEEDLSCKRCRPQPSPFRKVPSYSSVDKCP